MMWIIDRLNCAFFGHRYDYSREIFVPRLAGKSRYHVKVKGQKKYKAYGVANLCERCGTEYVERHE